MKRLLMLTLVVDRTLAGGMQLALQDLRCELERRGWAVEACIYRDSEDAPASTVFPAEGWIARLQRWPRLLRLRQRIPAGLRLTVSALLQSRELAEAAARNLTWAEEQLREPGRYDAVLVCVDYNVRGMLALALARHARVAVLSLGALTDELRPSLWRLVRWRRVHPFYFVPAKAKDIGCAIFASEQWRRQAVAAGLPPSVAHTIYFGIRLPERITRPSGVGKRLLWVGRLAPEKGLHLLLEALPALRARFPEVTLTAVAGQGEPAYRKLIEGLIKSGGLEGAVTLRPAVPREQLPELYAEHDALFFYSVNAEPVALVLMEAYANGLPVAANRASTDLVEDGVTCLTYEPANRNSIVQALEKVLNDTTVRTGLAEGARQRVEERYSLDAMGAAYDRLLGGEAAQCES